MSDYKPTTEAALVAEVYRVINSHGWMAGKAGVCVCGHDVDAVIGGTMNEHRAQAVVLEVLAAAGVTQPEPEYEYEYGNQATFHGHTQIMPVLDRDTAMKFAWLQPAFRRVKAGAWEPVPNQEGEQS